MVSVVYIYMISLTRKSIKMKTLLIIQMSTLASVIERMPYIPGENDVTQVSAGNFARAETDENIRQIAGVIEKATGRALNTWLHYRTLDSFFNPIVRQNRDTLYSMAILDTASGTLKIELPETKGRYQSVYCINQNHYQEYYATAPAIFKVKRQFVSTRYLFCIVRTLVTDLQSEAEMEEVHQLQDQLQITADQPDVASLNLATYDTGSLDKTRQSLLSLMDNQDSSKMFGREEDVDPISHVIGAAGGWGGLPNNLAHYETYTVDNNDGNQEYYIHLPAEVPVGGFWSITVYDENGYFFHRVETSNKNQFNAAKENDGSTIINFSNDTNKKNFINIRQGWTYTVRMYEPELPVLSGKWEFPAAKPVYKTKITQM